MLNITDVCNMALAHIAKGRISNIDEPDSANCFMSLPAKSY